MPAVTCSHCQGSGYDPGWLKANCYSRCHHCGGLGHLTYCPTCGEQMVYCSVRGLLCPSEYAGYYCSGVPAPYST